MQQSRWHWRRLSLPIVIGAALLLLAAFFLVRANSTHNMAFRVASDTGPTTASGNQSAPLIAALPVATSAAAKPVADVGGGVASSGATQNASASDQPRMLVKTGTLGLVIKDIDSGFGRIGAISGQYGGTVLQYSATKSGDVRFMDIVIQVDSKQFEAAMKALRELEGVVERKVDKAESQDVTEEYVDIQSQLTNLNLTEQQLRGILEKATRTEDILAVQREITTVRGQIEKLQGRANYLSRRSDLSNIAIRLESPPVTANPTTTPSSGRSFTGAVARAWSNSLAVLETLAIAVASVVVFCWWVFPLLIIGWPLVRFILRTRQVPTAATPPPSAPPSATSGD